jgi:hypothetical protein
MVVDDAIQLALNTLRQRRSGLSDLCGALGVPPAQRSAVRYHGSLGALAGILPAQLQGDHFNIVEGAPPAAILAAYHWLGDPPIDLVAVRLDEPSKAYRLMGVADALGEEAVARARYDSCPSLRTEPATLTIHANAIEWLRSGCEGCAILDHRRTPTILSGIDQYTTTATHAPKLYKALRQTPPDIGRVLAPDSESIAA